MTAPDRTLMIPVSRCDGYRMQLCNSNLFRTISRLLLVSACALILSVSDAYGQFFFGKNKVQYTDFRWKVMTTDHFNLYFYEDEQEVASIAAGIAEKAYRELAAKFNHEVRRKIPLIIYSSPRYFSQTNVTPGLVPESVGGFTEFLKGRVVVPFDGSYAEFAHVIKHELVHVMTISRLKYEIYRQHRAQYTWPPLWFIEGLAEHWSEDWDAEADMILADMVLGDRIIPIMDLWTIRGSYFTYKLGQSILRFIELEYGADKPVMIFENWAKARKFEEIVELTLGDNLEELSRKWEYWLKKQYFPGFDELGLPRMESTQLTHDGFSVKGVPIEWDDGHGQRSWLVFLANRMGYTGLYMKPRNESKKGIRTLLKGERSAKFESLHLLRSGIDANDSGLVVFSSLSKERDYLYVYDLNRGKVVRQFDFPDLISATSPRLSADGSRIVFSGARPSGFRDIYVVDVTTGNYRRITDDIYYDVDPAFSPGGESVVFASDRGPDGPGGAVNLFSYSFATDSLSQLTHGSYQDRTPDVTDHGIYFSSNRSGTNNIFLLQGDGRLMRQSTYATGAFDPRLTRDGEDLLYTGYEGMRFKIYSMALPEQPEPLATHGQRRTMPWLPERIDTSVSDASVKYDTDYSFDIAQSTVAYDPVYGTLGGVQGLFTDMLGNHMFHFVVSNTAEDKDDFLESFNVGVTYVNLENRFNWGVGGYHLVNHNRYFTNDEIPYRLRQAGGVGLLSYPFSKFLRVDLASYARYEKKDLDEIIVFREGFLLTNLVSVVYDNSLWEHSGPIEGHRYNLTFALTNAFSEPFTHNRMAWVDIRHYLRLTKASAFANRIFWYSSSGVEPRRIYFGGSWSFRGFSRRDFYSRNILFASNELRFPLVDNILIGFPMGELGFQAIRGALFFDVGSALDDKELLRIPESLYGSFGAGFRVSLGYFVQLRFDFSRVINKGFKSVRRSTDFDFFFGWNF
ncbi:MAG: PD40 domain-containing protein [Candidatus Zixiibacteriota bacterium]|nr:MAG: PD40 domain-containing protein [candidate division Zixibacteria bacterium]